MTTQLSSPVGFNHLKRIFGPNSVSEELTVPPAYSLQPKELRLPEWCYVVSLDPNHEFVTTRLPSARRGLPHADLLDFERVLTRALGLHLCAEPPQYQLGQLRRDSCLSNDEDGLRQPSDPLRFILPTEDVESDAGVTALADLNSEDFLYASVFPRLELYASALRRSSRGISWRLTRYPEFSAFQTETRLTRNPIELELGILSLLRLPFDKYCLPAVPGVARIRFKALLEGDFRNLMESILPRPG